MPYPCEALTLGMAAYSQARVSVRGNFFIPFRVFWGQVVVILFQDGSRPLYCLGRGFFLLVSADFAEFFKRLVCEPYLA
jgi:hypothetical protein